MDSPLGRFQLTQIKLETQIKHDIELNLPYDAAYSADRDSSIEKEKRTYSRVVKDSIANFNKKRLAQLDTPSTPVGVLVCGSKTFGLL